MDRRVVQGSVAGLLLVACRAGASLPPPPTETLSASDPAVPAVPEVAEPPVAEPPVAEPPVERAPREPSEPIAALAKAEAREPSEPPVPFAGQNKVRLDELIGELDRVADEIATRPAVRSDYDALVAAHGLRDDEALYRDYVRVKLAFEATRDAGLWRLSWAITNEKPNSDQIWQQWRKASPQPEPLVPTAIAECDELSAIFAFVARKLGVRHIGLFWPQWNHVVAVWTVQSADDSPVRIVVPTSQIFLTADDSLGTTGFDPWSQKTIYEYRRRDVKDEHRIDAALARFFVQQARRYAGLSQAELQRLRNERDLSLNSG